VRISRTIHLYQWTCFTLIPAVEHANEECCATSVFSYPLLHKSFQVVYRTMSTRSHSSHETLNLRILSWTFYISTASGALKLGSELYEVILSCYLPFRRGTYLRAWRSGFRVPAGVGGIHFCRTSQAGCGAHPASCSVGTRVRSVKLTT